MLIGMACVQGIAPAVFGTGQIIIYVHPRDCRAGMAVLRWGKIIGLIQYANWNINVVRKVVVCRSHRSSAACTEPTINTVADWIGVVRGR